VADEDDSSNPETPPAPPRAAAPASDASPDAPAPGATPEEDWSLASADETAPAPAAFTEPTEAAPADAEDDPHQRDTDAPEVAAPSTAPTDTAPSPTAFELSTPSRPENLDADWDPARAERASATPALAPADETSTHAAEIAAAEIAEAESAPAIDDVEAYESAAVEAASSASANFGDAPEACTPPPAETPTHADNAQSSSDHRQSDEAARVSDLPLLTSDAGESISARADAPSESAPESAALEYARAEYAEPLNEAAAQEHGAAFSQSSADAPIAEAPPALEAEVAEPDDIQPAAQDAWSVAETPAAENAASVADAEDAVEATGAIAREDADLLAEPAPEPLVPDAPIAFSEDAASHADPDPINPAPPPLAPDALPSNFFRAAGDPDEPEAAPPTFWQRLQTRAADTWRRARGYTEPRLVALGGDARALGFKAWRSARNIRHPRTVREAAIWGGWATAAVTMAVIGFFVFMTWGMPSTDDLWEARNGQSITFFDRRGNVILREGAQNAPPVDLDTLPPYVAQAFIAIEDRRFYDHWGVDIGGMARAGAENLRAGRVVQGGSTITQQLAKNLFLTNERSWRRKAQEIAMAIWLERRFSKKEILALYLSRVYFGAGAYGIEAAAERYFDRPARELTLLQSALIAGLVKAPSRLNPARQDIEAARGRGDLVLAEMVSMGFISDAERQAALQEEIEISRRNPAGVLAYYRDWIDPILNEVIGTQLDDFIVETTIDIQAQRAGAEAVEKVLEEQGESRRVGQAALVSLDEEGGVIAMVGGRDYEQSQFNRATQARRQPGSAFKYFIYLAAMENGLTPWSVREDGPITIRQEGQPDWTPGNYEEEYHGPSELSQAFQFSYNMVAIRVAHEVGRRKVIDVAERLGVSSELHDYPSLALGAQEVTLLEMTQAYGAMASQGYRVEPHGIVRIRRAASDETMWGWRRRGARERVIDEQPLRYMNYLMTRVVEAGTGTRARISGRQVGGKTGTGNDYRDAWFIGFTPGIVTGVWAGNDNFAETARVTGGSVPAEIWARFMPAALRTVPVRPLTLPGPEDFDLGLPDPEAPALAVVGAPLGNGPAPNPSDDEDRSLDLGPEG
jgi:penicillin-binding protein 1A